ncbi:MAG TPA: hypothetical protein VLD85_15440 [Anaeromyxobacteraceae bacterium]|nr:hypothetical protein [Anaeromyxobacteraceae bacterium]
MSGLPAIARQQANWTRYQPGQKAGHYESFFQRANHPSRPLAFWIRYTIFSPDGRPEEALGELWAVYFDGESGQHVAVKREVPFGQCGFGRSDFSVRVADASLGPEALKGAAASGASAISWDLRYSGRSSPLFLLPPYAYRVGFPRAKTLVGLPMAVYAGSLVVNGREIPIAGWVGSQNHNWGSRHTDHYAWGQVAGFDSHPDSFLEVATARIRIGPLWTPPMTLLVLRHQGEEIALNGLVQSVRARGTFRYFTWEFRSQAGPVAVEGTIRAAPEAFVGLSYGNPPGGTKHCLNTKLASCELELRRRGARRAAAAEVLLARHRAAFEILTDDRSHGVPIRA